MRLKYFILVICLCSAISLFAEVNYRVTSSSRLNVRRVPSTTGAIIGTFNSGEEITVLSINNGWAKVEFKNSVGYVSAKFISEQPKKTIEDAVIKEEAVAEIINETPEETTPENIIEKTHNNKISTPLTFGSSLSNKLSLFLALQSGFGYSNFLWNDGEVNGDMSFSADIVGQLYFEEKIGFIPNNWYSELALGYDKKGASNFGMNYLHARIYPLGYRIQLTPVDIVIKGGISLGFPLNDLETYSNYWSGDFQLGIGGGFQFEWKQFAIGCNIEYDFSEVASSCPETLNNIAILGTLSYKFAQLGHK